MNANPKFLAATAHVDDAAVKPLPNSRKVYVGLAPTSACRCARSASPTRPQHVRRREESADLRLRHLRALHRPGGEDRHPLGPAAAARALDRGAQRHRACSPARRSRLRPRAARRPEARRAALQPAAQAAPREGRHQRHADALRAPRHRHARRWSSSRSARTCSASVHREPEGDRQDRREDARAAHEAAPGRDLRRRDSRT